MFKSNYYFDLIIFCRSNKDDKMWKKVRPIILVSGQIDSDLNVGDKKIDKDKTNNNFLSILENFSIKHL